jgi:ketosteroid isomerase-like protein
MLATNNLFAEQVIVKRNFDALDHVYTADALILPPGAPMVVGLPAIKEFWAAAITSLNATGGSLESVEVLPTDQGLVEIGKAALHILADGQPVEVAIKYVVYWREENSAWKWHIDIWNTNS